jgi:hypothetical protein
MLTWVGKALKFLMKDDFMDRCTDGYQCLYHLIIAGFIADYEEQVLITSIKKAQYCSIYIIPPHERENNRTIRYISSYNNQYPISGKQT